jgi:excisionase family DNA binding protein
MPTTNDIHVDPRSFNLHLATYRPRAARQQLGVSHGTFYGLVSTGEIKVIKIGRMTLVPASEIANFLARKQASTESASAEAAPSTHP